LNAKWRVIYHLRLCQAAEYSLSSYIAQLLGTLVTPQITARIQGALGHALAKDGGPIHLPQTWWFLSDSGSATVSVDAKGRASVHDGKFGSPDVTVTWTDAAYYAAICLQDRSKYPKGAAAPSVVAVGPDATEAFDIVRHDLGL